MIKYETTKNTLNQLEYKMRKEHWRDIEVLESDDSRYTIALTKTLNFIDRVEELWDDYKTKSNTVDLVKGLEDLIERQDGNMTKDENLIKKKVARDILSIIEEIYFSEEYLDYRVNNGSNGTRDLIIEAVQSKYNIR